MTVQIIAQCIGALGIIVFLLCYKFKNMKGVLKTKLLVDIIWGIHYLLLGAYSGAVINAICYVREIIFMNNDKEIFKSKAWLGLFIGFNIVSAIFTWQGLYYSRCCLYYSYIFVLAKKCQVCSKGCSAEQCAYVYI